MKGGNETVIYLSNRYIRVLEGEANGNKLHVKNLYYTVDHRGSILNGTITDEEIFKELIKELWETNHIQKKGVKLLIDSTQFTTRVADAPILKPKQTMEYVSREFNDVERMENPVYGCYVLHSVKGDGKAKIQRLFSMMVPRAFVQKYIDIFAEVGITLSSVENAIGSALTLARSCPQGMGKTCIFQFVDDMTLISLLLVDGLYQYSGRNRLFSDPGTPEYAVEVARNVSNLVQFAKAQELAQHVPHVYVAGFDDDTYDIYRNSIEQIDDQMQVEHLDLGSFVRVDKEASGNQNLTNFAVILGSLTKNNPKTGLMAQMEFSPEKLAEKRKKQKVLAPILGLAGILAILVILFAGRVLYNSFELKKLEEYNNDEQILKNCETYDTLTQQVNVLGTLSGSMESLKNSVLSYPRVDRTAERTIENCASGLVTAQISNYDSSSGIVSFTTSSRDVNQIHKFITLLTQQDLFAAVDYTGYAQDSEGVWNVNVSCTMASRQEETDETETN